MWGLIILDRKLLEIFDKLKFNGKFLKFRLNYRQKSIVNVEELKAIFSLPSKEIIGKFVENFYENSFLQIFNFFKILVMFTVFRRIMLTSINNHYFCFENFDQSGMRNQNVSFLWLAEIFKLKKIINKCEHNPMQHYINRKI